MRTLLRDLGTVSGVQSACIVRGGEVLASSFADKDAVAQAASLGFVRGVGDALEKTKREFEELMIQFDGRSLMVVPVDKDFVVVMLAAPDANAQLLRVVLGSSVRQLRRMHGLAEKPDRAAAPRAEKAAAPQAAAGRPAAPRPAVPTPGRPQAAAKQPQAAAKPVAPGRPQASRSAPPPPPLRGQQPGARPAAQQQPKPQAPPPQKAARPEPSAAPAKKAGDRDVAPVLPQVLALLTEYIGPVARVSFKRGVAKWRETSTPTVGTLGELAKILAADLSSDGEKKAFMDAVDKLRGG